MPRGITWTEKELSLARKCYEAKMTSAEMATLFPKRSSSAVQTRITIMGLRTPRKTKAELMAEARKRERVAYTKPLKYVTTPCAQRELGWTK